MRRFFGVIYLGTLASLVLFATCEKANAAVLTRRESLRPLAQEIVDVVEKDQRQTAIAVGDFSGPAEVDHPNGGPGIAEDLKSLLEEIRPGIVQKRANLSLRGRYDKVAEAKEHKNDPEQIMIKITATITDRDAREIDTKFASIRDTGLIADLLGATVSLPPVATKEKRNEMLQRAVDKPTFHPEETKIRSSASSPYAIELLVTSKEHAPKDAKGWADIPPRAVQSKDGQAFVDIQSDEVYAIRVHNNFKADGIPYDSAVSVSIDGIDVFTFSEIRNPKTKQPLYKHFIVSPGTAAIPGWHKTNDVADSFLVTEYGKGAASQQPSVSRGKVGVITVRFALAWEGNEVPAAEKGARDGGKETGFGPPLKVGQKELYRHVGVVRDVITVRYTR